MDKKPSRPTVTDLMNKVEDLHTLWSQIYDVSQSHLRQYKAEIVDACSEHAQRLVGIENLIQNNDVDIDQIKECITSDINRIYNDKVATHYSILEHNLKKIVEDVKYLRSEEVDARKYINCSFDNILFLGRAIIALGALIALMNFGLLYYFIHM